MRYSPLILAGLVSFASAAPAARVSRAADGEDVPQWTIESMKRECDAADTSCAWSFGIQNNRVAGAAAVPCNFTVVAGEKPASQTDVAGIQCDFFTVSGGWSGQFGPDAGFTTLSIANFDTKLIAYPAYTDKELAGGQVVVPDRSYQPQPF
ncbi:uncharacterized protein B0I36DRAFT_369338 [Microdochium trichocladiopsis]|uniref:Small secreted protein n=1 Tax=Microdochium trichocladiopsis TaxID=1682393 RepID=A0A9P8XRX0_9PEZI|nr:uncharacterized protein B0I36DRAFT_369338 [Microdochium trichocladiopsis]KAH7014375.1 hypothetical protein B0I36DRAFT_369338 [Microdochium trichocladiopsis]